MKPGFVASMCICLICWAVSIVFAEVRGGYVLSLLDLRDNLESLACFKFRINLKFISASGVKRDLCINNFMIKINASVDFLCYATRTKASMKDVFEICTNADAFTFIFFISFDLSRYPGEGAVTSSVQLLK